MKQQAQQQTKCIYHKNSNGRGGIAIANDTTQKIYIAEDVECFALHLDEVIVSVDDNTTDNLTGKIIAITKHNTSELTGTIQYYKQQVLLKVNTPKFGHYLVILKTQEQKLDRDKLYKAKIITYPSDNTPYFEAELQQSIDELNTDANYIEQLLIEYKVNVDFNQLVEKEMLALSEQIPPQDYSDRKDLRHLPFVTIDGSDAKDFDDAVFCELNGDIFHLYVAISDVAHYVIPNSAVDKEAYLRGTSIYLPKQVIPMLPFKLSNGLCSLKPDVDRLVICCQIQLDKAGKVLDYQLYDAVIHSHARLTYDKVQDYINDLSITPLDLIANITNLYLVYQLLLTNRNLRGAIDFDTVETKFSFDNNGFINSIIPQIRHEAHKLIEECMLLANVCVADFLLKNNQPSLFRNHEKPSIEKFSLLKDYLNSLAINHKLKYETISPHAYADLLTQVHNHPQFTQIQQMVLRSMQLALYSPNNIGHFGLSYTHYTHFTSPIRRYPDLMVHRAIKAINNNQPCGYQYTLEVMGQQTSFTEARAEELSRKVNSFYQCQYAKLHLHQEFAGTINSVVEFGLFVYIKELMIEGLVHITELGNEYFIFNPENQSLVGRSSGKKFSSGEDIKVIITNVNLGKLFIDLQVVDK
jgi:ribonuclease R